MKPSPTRMLLYKLLGMFSVVRGYNIMLMIVAQYLSAIYILAPEKSALNIILDPTLFLIILNSSLIIASGYIINSFYDTKKDQINRPIKSSLDRIVSQSSRLYAYFTLNITATLIGFYLSFYAVAYFSTYIFFIWLYSHKLKRMPFIGNITAAVLAIFPFFGVFLYYKNMYEIIFFHAVFLFILILIREWVKDLENLKGDWIENYQTIPVLYSEKRSKQFITIAVIISTLPLYFLVEIYNVGYMKLFFYGAYVMLILFVILLWRSSTTKEYWWLHNYLKAIIVAGVFSIVLIDPAVLLKSRILFLLN
jgi:4-hydroxybenzoate polyprenyltransferase